MKENAKVKTKKPLDLDKISSATKLCTGKIEEDLFSIVNSIKFSDYKNDF